MKRLAGYMMIEAMIAIGLSALAIGGLSKYLHSTYIEKPALVAEAKLYADYQKAVSEYMQRFYGNLVQNIVVSGVLTPAFQSPLCDPSGRNAAHLAAYNNTALNREDGRRACLIPPTTVSGLTSCNNGESGCFTVYPACDASQSNKPCVTDHLRSYPLNPTSEDLKALAILDGSYPDVLVAGEGRMVSAIYKEGAGPDGYSLRAMIASDKPYLKLIGDADLARLGEIVNHIGPDAGFTEVEPAHVVFRFTAAAGQITDASAPQQYVLGGMDFATLSPQMGADAPAKLMIQSSRAGIEAGSATTPANWLGSDNYRSGGILVMRAGFGAANMDQFAMRDGSKAFTGNINLGGNRVTGFGRVKLDAPCDGVNAKSEQSKAIAEKGTLAMADADQIYEVFGGGAATSQIGGTNDKLGMGYLLACVFDDTVAGYIWRKTSAGVTTVEDAQAGMMEGYETGFAWVCFVNTTDLSNPLVFPYRTSFTGSLSDLTYSNGINIVKFVLKNGRVWAYIRDFNPLATTENWYRIDNTGNSSASGYELNKRYDWNTAAYAGIDYDRTKFPATGWGCNSRYDAHFNTQGDPNFQVWVAWTFGPTGVVMNAQGQVFSRNTRATWGYHLHAVTKELTAHAYDPDNPAKIASFVGVTSEYSTRGYDQLAPTTSGSPGGPGRNDTLEDIPVQSMTVPCGQVTANPDLTGYIQSVTCTAVTYNLKTTARAAPVRTYYDVPYFANALFQFQKKSTCVLQNGERGGTPIPWGQPPAPHCIDVR